MKKFIISIAILLAVIIAGTFFVFRNLSGSSNSGYDRGKSLLQIGMVREAEQTWRDAADANPKDPRPLLALGQLQIQQQRYAEAEEMLIRAVKLPNLPPHSYCLLAEAQWKRGDIGNALVNAEEEAKRDGNCARAHIIAGQIYERKSQPKEALDHLKQAAELSPEVQPVQLVYARVLAKTAQYREAESILRNILLKEPLHSDPYYWLGYTLSRNSRVSNKSEAERLLKRAMVMEPDAPSTHFELARLYWNQKRAKDALPFAQFAVKARPHDPPSLYLLGQIQRALGKSSEAAATLQRFKVESDLFAREKALLRTLATDTQNVAVILELTDVLMKRDRAFAALPFLYGADRIQPGLPEIRQRIETIEKLTAKTFETEESR
jgi:tetratricopeptide (TPR) repeat protein